MQRRMFRVVLALSLVVVVIGAALALLLTGRGGRRLLRLIPKTNVEQQASGSAVAQNKFPMIEDDVTDDEGWWKFQL